jgi:hypothetical protein
MINLTMSPPDTFEDAINYEQSVRILNHINATGFSSGALAVSGGLSVNKTAYVGSGIGVYGHSTINNVDITPNLNDIVLEQQAELNANQLEFTDITNFYFQDSQTHSFKAYVNVDISGPISKYAFYELNGLYTPSGWTLTVSYSGQVTGIKFNIVKKNSTGQIQYINTNSSDTITIIRFRATTNAPLGTTPTNSPELLDQNTNNFLQDNLVYANSQNTIASASDIKFKSNHFSVGPTSDVIVYNTSDAVDFSHGGSLTLAGGACVSKNLLVKNNVGIRTTNPIFSLDVNGDINFTGNLLQNSSMYSGSSNWSTNGINIYNTQTMGKLGIGTSSPNSTVDIAGTLNVQQDANIGNITTGTINVTGISTLTNATVTNITCSNLLSTTNISSGSINAISSTIANSILTNISSGNINANTFTGGTMSLSGDLVIAGTLTTINITTTNLLDTAITTGTINVTGISSLKNTIATNITCSSLLATTNISSGIINATNITTGTINVTTINAPLSSINDVKDYISVSNGNVLTWVSSTSQWEPQAPSGGVSTPTKVNVYPMNLIMPLMTSNGPVAGSGGNYYVSASSEFSSTYAAYKCLSSVQIPTEWATSGETSNFWIQVRFPTAQNVKYVYLEGRGNAEDPTQIKIQGSNDGSSFTDIISTQTFTGLNYPGYFSARIPENYNDYLYYRFLFPTGVGPNPGLLMLRLFKYGNNRTESIIDNSSADGDGDFNNCINSGRWPMAFNLDNSGTITIRAQISCFTTSLLFKKYVMYIDGAPFSNFNSSFVKQATHPNIHTNIKILEWTGQISSGVHTLSFFAENGGTIFDTLDTISVNIIQY